MSSTAIVVNRLLERLKFISRLLNRETPEKVAVDLKADWGKVEQLASRIDTILNKKNTSRQELRKITEAFRDVLLEERKKANDPIADAIINQKLLPIVAAKNDSQAKSLMRAIDLDGRLLVEVDKVFKDIGDIYIVRFFGPIDSSTQPGTQGLMRTMSALKMFRVVINFRRATCCDLNGLLPILQHKDRCDAAGGGMAFVEVPAPYGALVDLL